MASAVDNAPAIGRRVIVTGLAGSGKSTFSRALAARTGLPVLHLDLHFWQPGWVAPGDDEWLAIQRRVLAGDAWIADGNYHETLGLRLERADTVVVLRTPWPICFARALRRGVIASGAQMPDGCHDSAWRRLRGEWAVAARILRKRRWEPELEARTIADEGQHAVVHELRSRPAVQAFLDRLSGAGESGPGPGLDARL